jgi:uncharacterized repeat protein (TIGR02543 family)
VLGLSSLDLLVPDGAAHSAEPSGGELRTSSQNETTVTVGAFTLKSDGTLTSGGAIGQGDYSYQKKDGGTDNILYITTSASITVGMKNPGIETTTDRLYITPGAADGEANITLDSVDINIPGNNYLSALKVDGGLLNLTLTGASRLESGANNAGLHLNNANLIITAASEGHSLTAIGDSYAAGIGSGDGSAAACDITISGGTVNAHGGLYSAGIGSGPYCEMGNITITGGTVTAYGGDSGAGIGSSGFQSVATTSDIIITGGTVNATGDGGAGIGSGYQSQIGDIIISGGTVNATGQAKGAGIGSGYQGETGDITISGGTINATVTSNGAGIGCGDEGETGDITIDGGSVKASSINPKPLNSSGAAVYLNTLTVGDPSVASTKVTAGSIDDVACANTPDAKEGVYGIKDVTTDGSGKVCFYLPVKTNGTVTLTIEGNDYSAIHSRAADDNNNYTLTTDCVNISAIKGVTVPKTDDTPVTEITETEQYAGTVEWSPSVSGVFAPGTTYGAVITLTPKSGLNFDSVPEDFFTVVGATTTHNGADKGIVTAVFPMTDKKTVDIPAIDGVTVPVAGATPVTEITETEQYTGTVKWDPSVSGVFAPGTIYTVTITLKPKPGYTLVGVPADFFTVADATVVYNAEDSGVVTVVFPMTDKTVDIHAIGGVTVPVAGATPVTEITETEQYTGMIAWDPSVSGVFAPGTAYTAVITLKPKPGYTLVGVPADFFKVTGATATRNAADSGVVTVDFPGTKQPLNTVTVTFDANGGAPVPQRILPDGSALGALPNAGGRKGHIFTGWYTQKKGGTKVDAGTRVTGDVTYYAHWQAKVYNVKFRVGSKTVKISNRVYGSKLGKLPKMKKKGYLFKGWYTKKKGGTKVRAKLKLYGNKVYYAHWVRDKYGTGAFVWKCWVVRMHIRPYNCARVVKYVRYGSNVEYLSQIKTAGRYVWYKVKYGGRTGYIYSRFIRLKEG